MPAVTSIVGMNPPRHVSNSRYVSGDHWISLSPGSVDIAHVADLQGFAVFAHSRSVNSDPVPVNVDIVPTTRTNAAFSS
jgi:hypothetical protein